jgi:lysophospholipase L1-like esterase
MRTQVIFCCIVLAGLICSSAAPLKAPFSVDLQWGGHDSLHHILPIRPQPLQFPGGRGDFDRYHEQLSKVLVDGTGGIRIVHLGGSHVQAGWMGDRIRERWLELAGTACSRGLIAPYRLAGTNTPPKIRTEMTGDWDGTRCSRSRHNGPFGGTGLSAVTFDSSSTWWHAAIRIDSSLYATTKLTVLAQSNGFVPQWRGTQPGIQVTRKRHETGSGWTFTFNEPIDTIFLGLSTDTAAMEGPRWFRLHGLVSEDTSCPCEGLIYHEIGNNGASTASVLRGAADEAFARDWQALQPDLVIFGLGINDAHVPENRFNAADFTERYDSLIGLIKATAPATNFLFLTNSDSYYSRRPNPSALLVREAMFQLAARHQAGVFDLFDAMGGLGSIRIWKDEGYAQPDLIHFTRNGYRTVADLYWDALMLDWANSESASKRRVIVPTSAQTKSLDWPSTDTVNVDPASWKS